MAEPTAEPTAALNRSGAACWRCDAPVGDTPPKVISLYAASRRQLAAFGYPVTRGRGRDKVRIAVPKCARCRAHTTMSIVVVLGGALAGAIVATVVQSWAWPVLDPPTWVTTAGGSAGTPSGGVGAVLGFAAAAVGVAVYRRRAGLRSLNDYPAVVRLRRAGWQYSLE